MLCVIARASTEDAGKQGLVLELEEQVFDLEEASSCGASHLILHSAARGYFVTDHTFMIWQVLEIRLSLTVC